MNYLKTGFGGRCESLLTKSGLKIKLPYSNELFDIILMDIGLGVKDGSVQKEDVSNTIYFECCPAPSAL